MSEPIKATVNVPENAAPEAQEQAAAAPETLPQDASMAHAASISPADADKIAAEEERLQKAAQSTLTDCARAFRRGEKAYRAGLFDAGRLAQSYVQLRVKLGAKRKTAIDAIEGELAKYASATPDANRLILASESFRLLSEGMDAKAADAVPYGHFRDQYARLVERVNKDSADETYVLLGGLETECKTLFLDATKAGLSKDDVGAKVQGVLKTYADRQADAAKQAKGAAELKAHQDAQAAQWAKAKAAEAEKAVAEAQKAVAEAKDEQKAAMTAQLEAQKEAARKAADEAAVKNAAAEQAAREAARKAEAEKAAKEAAAKAAAKAAAQAKGEKPAKKAPVKTAEAAQGTNILATLAGMAKQGNVKDTANVIADMVMSAKDPLELWGEVFAAIAERFNAANDLSGNDALMGVLAMAKDCDHLSASGQRAAKAGLVVLAQKRSPSPAELANAAAPQVNGQLVKA